MDPIVLAETIGRLLDSQQDTPTGMKFSELLRWNGNPELKSMALLEFAADHPKEISDSLPTETDTPPSLRATLMARLDPQFPDQAAAVDQYLRDPARTDEEAAVFLKAFPLRSATTGTRLYGLPPAPYQRDQIAAGDRAALFLVERWLVDPELESIRPELTTLQKRLDQWVEQAK